jgi:hypothetical protein
MYLGFTGKSTGITSKIINFLNVSRKATFLSIDVLGTLLMGIGGAWLTSKGIDQYDIYFESNWSACKDLVKSPVLYILIGIFLYAFAKIYQWLDNNNLYNINSSINSENKKLESQMRGVTEDKEILNKKLELAYRELVITWLSTSMQVLGILHSNIRATVYYFKDGAFHYVGRHSKNPMIAQVSTNKVVLNGGVLSQAWINGSYEDLEDCPLYTHNKEEYFLYQLQQYGFDKEKVQQLTMKPCQYYAKTIIENCEPIGIIIFESDSRFLTSSRVNKIGRHCVSHESNLIGYIKKMRDQDTSTSQKLIANIEADFLRDLDKEGKDNE